MLCSCRVKDSFEQPELFAFDHIYYKSSAGSPVVILYGALGTDCFRDFHFVLAEASKKVTVEHDRHIYLFLHVLYFIFHFSSSSVDVSILKKKRK